MSYVKISQLLIQARSHRGIALPNVAEETKISLAHLEALERDDYDQFPNYALALGFLRSYVDFLGLDADQISLAFQKAVDEGLEYKKNPLGVKGTGRVSFDSLASSRTGNAFSFLGSFSFVSRWLVALVVLVALAGLSKLLYDFVIAYNVSEEKVIEWDGVNLWEGVVVAGDRLILSHSQEILASLLVIEAHSTLFRFRILEGEHTLGLGETYLLDITKDGREDLMVSYMEGKRGLQVVLRPVPQGELLVTANTLADRNKLFPKMGFTFSPLDAQELGTVYLSSEIKPDRTSLKLTFREDSLVRYLVDEATPEEIFFRQDSVIELSFGLSLLLWVANPSAVSLALNSQSLDLFGDSPLGIVQLIWVQTVKGFFELKFLPL